MGKKTTLLGLKVSILLGFVSGMHNVDKQGIVHNVEDDYNDLF